MTQDVNYLLSAEQLNSEYTSTQTDQLTLQRACWFPLPQLF
jgi:hypothetical protein